MPGDCWPTGIEASRELSRGEGPVPKHSKNHSPCLVGQGTERAQNAYGVVYEIEGPIKTPSGKTLRFCSIWQVDTGTDVPRFITMYPR